MFGGKKFVCKKNILILIFVMVCLCGCGKKEDTSKYEYGSYDNIEDKFEILSNTHSQVCVAGGFDRVVVDYAEVVVLKWLGRMDCMYPLRMMKKLLRLFYVLNLQHIMDTYNRQNTNI